MVAEFAANSGSSCLELPHLTTGQRKGVKSLLQQYPNLCCESYGFGADRRLHIFKAGCSPKKSALDQPCIDAEILQVLPADKLPVRNTFIHIDDASVDDRAVQSMPHGMFRQYVSAEISSKIMDEECPMAWPETPTSEPEAEPIVQISNCEEPRIGIGALVLVEGLTKAPAFNGLSGVVQSWDETLGRYGILLVSADGACHQAKVKEQNLRLVMPCP